MDKKWRFFAMFFILAVVLIPKRYAGAVSLETAEKAFMEFLKQSDEKIWNECEENSYAISDLNGDGIPEMLRKGKDKNTGGEKVTVYCYDELKRKVKQAGSIGTATDDCVFFYSPGRRCFALCTVYNWYCEYKFYSLTDMDVKEKFCVSYSIDGDWVNFYYTEKGKETLLLSISYEDWSDGNWNLENWEKYTGDLQRIEFQIISWERYVSISVEGEEYGTYPIWIDREIEIGKTNVCKIESGMCRMIEADCPKHICISQGKIKNNGETIICLPNKVIIETISYDAEETDKNQIDAFAY